MTLFGTPGGQTVKYSVLLCGECFSAFSYEELFELAHDADQDR
jgi:hypothetical protein